MLQWQNRGVLVPLRAILAIIKQRNCTLWLLLALFVLKFYLRPSHSKNFLWKISSEFPKFPPGPTISSQADCQVANFIPLGSSHPEIRLPCKGNYWNKLNTYWNRLNIEIETSWISSQCYIYMAGLCIWQCYVYGKCYVWQCYVLYGKYYSRYTLRNII